MLQSIYFNFWQADKKATYAHVSRLDANTYIKTGDLIETVYCRKMGEAVDLVNIEQIAGMCGRGMLSSNKLFLPALQMFNSGKREANIDDNNISNWNGCVFVDIDTKKYNGRYLAQFEANKEVFMNMSASLMAHGTDENGNRLDLDSCDNLLFAQISASGNSYHYVFYFDVEKTMANFAICAKYALCKVKAAMATLMPRMYNEIIQDATMRSAIFDDCSNKIAQPLYLSNHAVLLGNECAQGRFNVDEALEFISRYDDGQETFATTKFSDEDSVEAWEFTQSRNIGLRDSEAGSEISWSYSSQRWPLIKGLIIKFMDDFDRANNLWQDLVPIMVNNGNNHNESYLRREFKINYKTNLDKIKAELLKPIEMRSARYARPATWVLDLMKRRWGINYKLVKKFTPRENANYINACDDVTTIELEAEERISDYFTRIINSSASVIHVQAGCGYGKTYAARNFVTSQISDLFGSTMEVANGRRVCFITPNRAINKDSFDGVDGWKIVDGDHANKNYIDSNYSICTTWDSLVNCKLYEKPFDLFIIDESHELFNPDYRLKAVHGVLNIAIPHIIENNRKLVLFTGTPCDDYYIAEDKAAHFRFVRKNITRRGAHVVFFGEGGWQNRVSNDVKAWLEADENNRAYIYHDMANDDLADSLDCNVDFVYSKKNAKNVEYLAQHHHISGRCMLCSLYGRTGINIYPVSEEEQAMIFVISDNSSDIIQYINRYRDKTHVEAVNIYASNASITNSITACRNMQGRSREKEERYLNLLTSLNMEANKFYNFSSRMLHNINRDYVNVTCDGNNTTYTINDNLFAVDDAIQRNNQFNRQTQIIHARLVDAEYEPSYEYDATPREKKAKHKGHFADCLEAFDYEQDVVLKTVYRNGKETTVKAVNEECDLYKHLSGECETAFNRIINVLSEDEFNDLIDKLDEGDMLTKTNIKRFSRLIQLKQYIKTTEEADIFTALFENQGKVNVKVMANIASAIVERLAGSFNAVDYQDGDIEDLFSVEPTTKAIDPASLDMEMLMKFSETVYDSIREAYENMSTYEWFIVDAIADVKNNPRARQFDAMSAEVTTDERRAVYEHLCKMNERKRRTKTFTYEGRKYEDKQSMYLQYQFDCSRLGKTPVTYATFDRKGLNKIYFRD